MEDFEATENVENEMPLQQSLSSENKSQLSENTLQTDNTDTLKNIDNTSNPEKQTSVETTNVSSIKTNVASENDSVVSSDNSLPPLPPTSNDDKGQLPQPPAAYSADYNMQNYANYNYMYNYNNYYGYPYPQYQWDYNSQQYYQPYQNYYNYNYNANQAQTSKPPPPPPGAVQLPVEEKPANKSNTISVDDSNRYSPTAETDDDDTMKGLSENKKSDVQSEQPQTQTAIPFTNSVPIQTASSEQTDFQNKKSESENIDPVMQQPIFPSVTLEQQPIVPLIAQIQQYNIPIQQPSYSINSQIQSTETINEVKNQPKNPLALNGKDDSAEKVSKGSTVLGKTQAKKRLMAFSMMKQKLQEQNSLNNDNPNLDVGEGNDVEFVPELNVFQTVPKKKVVTNKKVVKVIKAQQTIEQIEEMKKDELLQGNNAALYQHLLRSGGNEAPILQKLGIESLAEKYSAKIREQDKRMKRHHHRRRDDNRRSHKYRRRSHSKSRSRSRSAEKPKMRALEVKSWKDFVNGGFHFDRFRRFKLDEAEELKEKERKSRSKKRHSDSRSDGKNQNTDSGILTEADKGNGDQKLRYNILDQKKEIRKGLEVITNEADFTKDFPSYIIQYTKTKPVIKYSENPATATRHLQNRQQMLATLLPEIEIIVHKFLSEMKPKKLKENITDDNFIYIDDKLLLMMKDKKIYPFKGWWPKTCFIVTQVKENPNIEIDKDALTNQFSMSKRTKKSRFDDDTSLVDIRPTVPSKWDSDYDGSPATEKVVDVEVSQNVEMNVDDNVQLSLLTNTEETNPLDISHQEEAMDTASDIGENEPKIEINVGPILPVPSIEPQGHAKLDTEYEEFLKIVSAEKNNEKIENGLLSSTIQKEDENDNQSVKSVSLNNESVEVGQDDDSEDSSSSDESASLHNIADESMDTSFVKKLKKKKKSSNKKSKKYKKKEGRKKKRKSSSSESSQISESESDSSSEDSESESTDSTLSIEKKKKKKSKDKKKKKSKVNYKKKHKGDKIKLKNSEEENDNNSSILNLLEKAFNVEIKKRPLDHDEPKQKKKKRKHDKKEKKSSGENEDKFEKVKECLKETFTKLVKTDIGGKNQSLSCDDSTVNEVLKYFKMDDEKDKKKKKSKKNNKRKYDSDISESDKIIKKFRLDDGLKHSDSEKKKKSKKKKSSKKYNDSDEQVLKKKSKKKLKTSDTSETDDGEGSILNKSKNEKGTEHFFGLRPNEWNENNQSSMRGVVHHSDVKNTLSKNSEFNEIDKLDDSKSLQLNSKNLDILNSTSNENEKSSLLNNLDKYDGQTNKLLKISDKNIESNVDNVSINIARENIKIDFRNFSDIEKSKEEEYNIKNVKTSNKSEQCDKNLLEHKNDLLTTVLSTRDNFKQQESIKDPINIFKPTQSQTLKQSNDSPNLNTLSKQIGKPISYRDKVKMNLKKLSTCQHIPFVFGFSSSIDLIKSNNLKIEKIRESFDLLKEEAKPKLDESKVLKVDRPKVAISPETQKESNVINIIPHKIDVETDNKVLDHSCSWEDSEESNSDQSTITSENSSDESESDHIDSSLMEDDTLNKNQSYDSEIFLNDGEDKHDHLQLHIPGMSKSNYSSDTKNKEQEYTTEVDNIELKERITTSFNSCDLRKYEQHFESNSSTTETKNDGISDKIVSSLVKDSDSMCSRINARDTSKIDNELITQWKSDWNELNKSVIENNKSINHSSDETIYLKSIKKSRWDEEPCEETDSFIREKEFLDKASNFTNNRPKSTSSISSEYLEEQNQTSDVTSIKSGNDSSEVNNCSESLSNVHSDDDYSQSYEQYSRIPLYSDLKSIETSELSPVDYSLYENYNPNYEYCDNYEMWKSLDSSQQLTSIPITNDTTLPSSLQVGKVSEISHTIFSNESAEFLKEETELLIHDTEFSVDQTINNNIVTIIPDVENEVVEKEKSESTIRNEQFVQLYQQHFQHYNQNPVKYSLSDPELGSITEVNFSSPEKLSQEELSDIDQKIDKLIPIPLQDRAYSCLTKDDNTNIYLTSDNYIAYCAVEDKCMVHIAVDSTSRDGIEDKVRHCFNINQNGTTIEYWLHADLIPFHVPSDAESGVFSDDDDDESLESDSGLEEHATPNDDNEDNDNEYDDNDNDDGDENPNMILGEWEIVDSDNESNVDSWLDNPSIIEKYGENCIDVAGQTIPVINQEENASNSSDYDSDISDISDSNVQSYSNGNSNIYSNQLHNLTIEDENKSSNIIDKFMTNNDVNLTENTPKNISMHVENDDSPVASSDQLVSDDKSNKKIVLLEDNKVSTDEMFVKNHDSILLESEEKVDCKKESDILTTGEVATEDILMMDTIINQQLLIQRLKLRAKEKIQEKLPDTVMVQYSDNMETIKYPFLGLFQPPTISILSKQQSNKSNSSKHVTFADGILPGEDLAASPTHDNVGRPLSPPPLKTLMREILKFKRNMYPFKRSKVRTKLTMVNKKVATVIPSIKATTSSVIEYYVSQRRLEDLPIAETTVFRSNNSPSSHNNDHTTEKMSSPLRPTRELTPIPSDNECWDDDDDNVKDTE